MRRFILSMLFLLTQLIVTSNVWAAHVEPLQMAAERLAAQLQSGLTTITSSSDEASTDSQLTGIASFVMADNLQLPHQGDATASLGQQLSEALYTELNQRHVALVDFRARDFIAVSAHGETVLSRDIEQLPQYPQVDRVVVGTLAPREHGVLVQVRVLDRRTQQVLASASDFISKRFYWHQRQVEVVNGRLQRESSEGTSR